MSKKSDNKKTYLENIPNVFIILLGIIVLFVIAVSAYQKFAIWDASNPTQDHSWYNQLLFRFTPTIKPQVLNNAIKKGTHYTLIDVRSEDEYNAGHIPSAINISEQTLHNEIPLRFPDKSELIYMNCNTGHKGAVSIRLLRSMGYTNAWNIEDGLDGWKARGYRVELD